MAKQLVLMISVVFSNLNKSIMYTTIEQDNNQYL